MAWRDFRFGRNEKKRPSFVESNRAANNSANKLLGLPPVASPNEIGGFEWNKPVHGKHPTKPAPNNDSDGQENSSAES